MSAPVLFAAPPFGALWSRSDEPVASGAVQRGFVWGPAPASAGLMEPYAEAPGGQRLVQYFDKARMELTDPASGAVTTGLLTRELVTGRIQTGDSPAAVEVRTRGSALPIVGDATNIFPTYAQLRPFIDRPQPDRTGQFATDLLAQPLSADVPLVVTSDGMPGAADDASARLVRFVPETGQTVPQAFWAFMNAGGPVMQGGALVVRTPRYDWVAVVGLPISPAYWVTARVGGTPTPVLLQLFERRVLTYTPTNPEGFKVEMGNIGQHYFQFRYLSPDALLLPATVAPVPAGTPRPPRPTATPRPVATPIVSGTGPVRIASIVARPPDGAADLNGETVTLRNDGLATVDCTRWTLVDASGKNAYLFPPCALPPAGTLTIHTGRGANTATDLYWGKTVPIWKDSGDTAILRDATGAVIATYTYG